MSNDAVEIIREDPGINDVVDVRREESVLEVTSTMDVATIERDVVEVSREPVTHVVTITERITTEISSGMDQVVMVAGPQGAQGIQGEQGPPGPGGGAPYVHVQHTASDVWLVVHNLGKFPTFMVEDTAGTPILGGDAEYLDLNTMTITFGRPFAGTAYL